MAVRFRQIAQKSHQKFYAELPTYSILARGRGLRCRHIADRIKADEVANRLIINIARKNIMNNEKITLNEEEIKKDALIAVFSVARRVLNDEKVRPAMVEIATCVRRFVLRDLSCLENKIIKGETLTYAVDIYQTAIAFITGVIKGHKSLDSVAKNGKTYRDLLFSETRQAMENIANGGHAELPEKLIDARYDFKNPEYIICGNGNIDHTADYIYALAESVLNSRQYAVFEIIEMPNIDIADILGISVSTVKRVKEQIRTLLATINK